MPLLVDEPLGEKVKGPVKKWQYNKIRILLNAIQRKTGFPTRPHMRVAFYACLMFTIPQDTQIHYEWTRKAWEEEPGYFYRKVKIYNIIVPGTPAGDVAKVLVSLMGIVGLGGLPLDMYAGQTEKDWPIYENLLQKGGLSNDFIDHNWDKIRKELISNGYGAEY